MLCEPKAVWCAGRYCQSIHQPYPSVALHALLWHSLLRKSINWL
jgi:hypothetical protein